MWWVWVVCGGMAWVEEFLLHRVACAVAVDVEGFDVRVLVFGSVFQLCAVDKGVHFRANTVDVELGDGEEVVFDHKRLCMCLWWAVQDDTYYFLLDLDEGLEVCFLGFA